MDQSERAAAVARELARAAIGFRAGTAYLWGHTPTKPDDSTFEVKTIAAAENGMRLDFSFNSWPGVSGTLEEAVLSVWQPGEIRVSPDAITIGRATRLEWGQIKVTPVGKDEVEIHRAGEVVRRRSSPNALVLRLQMGEPKWTKTYSSEQEKGEQ